MKRWSWLVLLAVALAMPACDEEEPSPPGDRPTKEGTVQLLISDAWDPCYAPDSAKVVFVEAYHLAVYDTVSRRKITITPDYGSAAAAPCKPTWLAGDVVAFVRRDETTFKYHVWTVPATGGDVTRFDVTTDPDSALDGDAAGRYVFYTAESEQLLYRLDLQSGRAIQVTKWHLTGYAHYNPVQDPAEEHVFFVEREFPFNPLPHPEYVYEVKSNGQAQPVTVLNTDKPFLEGLTISGDDKYMIFPHRDGLFAYEYKSGELTWLTRAPGKWTEKDRNPSYSPDDANIVFERSGNVYICDAM